MPITSGSNQNGQQRRITSPWHFPKSCPPTCVRARPVRHEDKRSNAPTGPPTSVRARPGKQEDKQADSTTGPPTSVRARPVSHEDKHAGNTTGPPTLVRAHPVAEHYSIVVPRYSRWEALNAWRFGGICRVQDNGFVLVRTKDSFLEEWNASKPKEILSVGDKVWTINGKSDLVKISKELASQETLTVTLQRSPPSRS